MLRKLLTLTVSFASIATIVITCAAPSGWTQPPDEGIKPSELPQLREIAEKYKIEIATSNLAFPVKTTHGLIEGKEALRTTLKAYQPLFAAEVNRYPISLIQRSKIIRIVLCEELFFDGQRRNAIPDFEHEVLYLDVKRGDYNKLYQRKVIHHEFFHLVDYKDDGAVYSDKVWAALNPPTFQYGTGGRNAQNDASTSILTNRFPGFLNHYSTTGVEEDKAEMFANMMVEPKHVMRRASVDPVVDAKLSAMKSLMLKFCPDVNEQFWKREGLATPVSK